MSAPVVELLREAGVAMLRAGLRLDLVRRIEDATGDPIRLPEKLEPKHVNVAKAMREFAAAVEKAGRPLSADEVVDMIWPGRTVWQARGLITHFVAAGWVQSVRLRGPSTAYALGKSTSWKLEARKADIDDQAAGGAL